MGRAKRIWYSSPMRAAKVQASLRIRAVSPEPPLLAHTRIESRGTFRQKARSLAPLNGWACAVKVCHDGMLEDTNSLDGAQIFPPHDASYINGKPTRVHFSKMYCPVVFSQSVYIVIIRQYRCYVRSHAKLLTLTAKNYSTCILTLQMSPRVHYDPGCIVSQGKNIFFWQG